MNTYYKRRAGFLQLVGSINTKDTFNAGSSGGGPIPPAGPPTNPKVVLFVCEKHQNVINTPTY